MLKMGTFWTILALNNKLEQSRFRFFLKFKLTKQVNEFNADFCLGSLRVPGRDLDNLRSCWFESKVEQTFYTYTAYTVTYTFYTCTAYTVTYTAYTH